MLLSFAAAARTGISRGSTTRWTSARRRMIRCPRQISTSKYSTTLANSTTSSSRGMARTRRGWLPATVGRGKANETPRSSTSRSARHTRGDGISTQTAVCGSSPNSVHEVGCIHTCQGLELDYVGVIVGPDFIVRNGRVRTVPEARARQDQSLKGYGALLAAEPVEAKARADLIIKNTYRTLMTRGMTGCYVFCTDPKPASTSEIGRAFPPLNRTSRWPSDLSLLQPRRTPDRAVQRFRLGSPGCVSDLTRALIDHPEAPCRVFLCADWRGTDWALLDLLDSAKEQLDRDLHPAGFNIGINDGVAAGQTVQHLHIHLIPRYPGDREDPRGGIRWIIPEKADYWSPR